MAKRHGRWLSFVDAVYGSAAYLPMANGAPWGISVTQSGFIARPVNGAAEKRSAPGAAFPWETRSLGAPLPAWRRSLTQGFTASKAASILSRMARISDAALST